MILTLAAGLTAVGTAQAEGKIYVGGKVGVVQADFSGFDNAFNAGVRANCNRCREAAAWYGLHD